MNSLSIICGLMFVLTLAVSGAARAQEPSSDGQLPADSQASAETETPIEAQADRTSFGLPYERGGLAGLGLVLGIKAGGGFGQPFGDFGTSWLAELELGLTLPAWNRAIEVLVSGAYTQPKAEGKGLVDPRLPGPASYELLQQQAMGTLAIRYRIRLPIETLRPYASLGPRVFLMRTKTSGEAGREAFGENEETATKFGAFGALGAELHLGAGAFLFESAMTWAKLDGHVLRDTSAGAVTLALGYRLFL